MLGTLQLFIQLPIASFDQACEIKYQQLRAQGVRAGAQDLKIAAVALVNRLTLLTRNRRDFSRVPGLLLHDWTT